MSGAGHGRAFWRAGIVAAVAVAALVVAPAVASAAGFVVVGSRTATGVPLLRTFADNDNNTTYEKLVDEVVPFKTTISDGVRVAGGDFNGDGNDEVAAATDKSTAVKIFELNPDGSPGGRVGSLPGFAHGTYVAAGDINNDGRDELVTSGGPNDGEIVRIRTDLDLDGIPDDVADSFAAYPATRKGGVRVAMGNVSNAGGDEVITAPGPPDNLPVKVWRDADNDLQVSDNPLEDQVKPFGNTFTGGMFVASGMVENAGGNGAEVIVTRADNTGKMVIRTDSDNDGKVSDNPLFDQVLAPYPGSTRGARVAAGDTDHSGAFVELLTAPGQNTGTNPVKIFDDDGDPGTKISDNPLDDSFTAFPGTQGAHVAFARVFRTVYPFAGAPQSIPEPGTLQSTIQIPGSAGIIQDLDVSLDIAHTFDGDLDVTLARAQPATSMTLFTDVGGTDAGFQIRLNDEAGTDIGSADNPTDGPISGTFNPEGTELLSIFDGQDATGRWTLSVTDDNSAGADIGTLQDWSLIVSY
jgi:subtilisin-like proprotein convertase family protein